MANPAVTVQLQNLFAQAGFNTGSVDSSQLATVIANLPPQVQQQVIQQLGSSLSASGGGSLSQAGLDQITSQIQTSTTGISYGAPGGPAAAPMAMSGSSIQNPLAQPSVAGQHNAQQSGFAALGAAPETAAGGPASAGGGVNSSTAGAPAGTVTPSTIGGQDLAAGERAYGASNWGSGLSSDWHYLAGYLGISPEQAQQGYEQYRYGGNHGQDTEQRTRGQTPQQWVANQVTTLEGKYAPILNAYEMRWEHQNNGPMPPELRAALRQQVKNLSPEESKLLDGVLTNYLQLYGTYQGTLGTAFGSTSGHRQDEKAQSTALNNALTATVGQIPALENVFSEYTSKFPNQQTTQASLDSSTSASFISQYHSITGHIPSNEQIQASLGMNASQLATYYDNLPAGNGLTYGAYNATLNNLTSAGWLTYFGKDPSAEQVYQFHGRNKADIQAYIDGSSSRIPGMTIGTYNNLQTAGQDISTKLFGQANSDQMLQLFAQSKDKQ